MKAPGRKSELDRLVTKLRAALRRETTSILEIGGLLLQARKLVAAAHGEWMPWLSENFDLSYRTALRSCKAAEYAAAKKKSVTVTHLSSLSPTVLYGLAEGAYTPKQEAAILAESRTGIRIDVDRAQAICASVEPKPPPPKVPPDDDDDGAVDAGGVDDDDVEKLLDDPPPAVPPPSVSPPELPSYTMQSFDSAVGTLRSLTTKSGAAFARTTHSAAALEDVEQFIRQVRLFLDRASKIGTSMTDEPIEVPADVTAAEE
jgi:hypothetical protein